MEKEVKKLNYFKGYDYKNTIKVNTSFFPPLNNK
jgi:hypothetical protein